MNRTFVALLVASIVVLSAFLIWYQTTRPPSTPLPPANDAEGPHTDDDGRMLLPDGDPVTAELVREVCEREIRLRSDLPFTEFPRPGAPEYSEPAYDPGLEAWVWVIELVYEEGMALRREWECRITAEGQGLLRRNY